MNDAFTRGGAQVGGGQRSFGFTFGSDLDYVRGIAFAAHRASSSMAAAIRADDTSNYLGTYTFESLAAYEAGRPRSYTRRIGDPLIRYRDGAGCGLRAGRHQGPAELHRQRRRTLRGADPRGRLRQPDAARRLHLGAVQDRHRRRCVRAGGSSTTGCTGAPTSRPCAWTASASGRSTSAIRRIRRFPRSTRSASRCRSAATCSATISSCRARPVSAPVSISAVRRSGFSVERGLQPTSAGHG